MHDPDSERCRRFVNPDRKGGFGLRNLLASVPGPTSATAQAPDLRPIASAKDKGFWTQRLRSRMHRWTRSRWSAPRRSWTANMQAQSVGIWLPIKSQMYGSGPRASTLQLTLRAVVFEAKVSVQRSFTRSSKEASLPSQAGSIAPCCAEGFLMQVAAC